MLAWRAGHCRFGFRGVRDRSVGVVSLTNGRPCLGYPGLHGSVAIWAQIARRIRHNHLLDAWIFQAFAHHSGISLGKVLLYAFGVALFVTSFVQVASYIFLLGSLGHFFFYLLQDERAGGQRNSGSYAGSSQGVRGAGPRLPL